MISVQKKLQERVPGFHFNFGFSGGYFLAGNDKEDEGDWELVKNADKFWWFSHMWHHQQPHNKNTLEEMIQDLKKNLEFAKVGMKKKSSWPPGVTISYKWSLFHDTGISKTQIFSS